MRRAQRFKTALAALLILGATACTFGRTGKDLAFARQPGGALVVITTPASQITGELIAVRDDGIIVAGQQLTFYAFSKLGGLRVDQMGSAYRVAAGRTPSATTLAKLRRVSHFPQGLTPELEQRLLALRNQAAMNYVR